MRRNDSWMKPEAVKYKFWDTSYSQLVAKWVCNVKFRSRVWNRATQRIGKEGVGGEGRQYAMQACEAATWWTEARLNERVEICWGRNIWNYNNHLLYKGRHSLRMGLGIIACRRIIRDPPLMIRNRPFQEIIPTDWIITFVSFRNRVIRLVRMVR